jgi:hypothetical protein
VLNAVIANNICASLDVAGAAFTVEACGDDIFSLTAWPTAAHEEVWVRVQHSEPRAELGLFTAQGELISTIRAIGSGETVHRIGLAGLPMGQYMVRLVSGGRMMAQRFVRVD